MTPLRTLLVLALASSACGLDANYTLQLRPVVPLNQSPFSENPTVWVGQHSPDGGTTWTDFEALNSGSARQNGFGPLDGDRIGVALTTGASPEAEPDGVFAYGETAPLDLSTGGEELELGVLVAETDGVGALSSMEEPYYGAALAVLNDGRAYAFGGIKIAGGACLPDIQRMNGLNDGDWVFRGIRASLPTGVCYAVATVVEIGGREQILLTGGETVYNGFNQRVNDAILFDPATEEVTDTTSGTFTRARHTVAPLPDGRLLLVGTHQIGGVPPSSGTWEIFDPAEFEFGPYGTTDVAPWEFMAAPIPGGVALCGGGRWVSSNITPLSACFVLRGDGGETPLPSLPNRSRAGSMTRLSDGRLLVVGGITESSSAGPNEDATDAAYIIDLESDDPRWELVGRMNEKRAYAELIPDGFGGAIVIGGAEAAWGFGSAPDRPAECGERLVFNGDEASFVPLETCGEGGTGVLPSVAVHPSFGALMLEGRNDQGDGGQAVGFWSSGP